MTIMRELSAQELKLVTGGAGKSLKCIVREVVTEALPHILTLAFNKALEALNERNKSKSTTAPSRKPK